MILKKKLFRIYYISDVDEYIFTCIKIFPTSIIADLYHEQEETFAAISNAIRVASELFTSDGRAESLFSAGIVYRFSHWAKDTQHPSLIK